MTGIHGQVFIYATSGYLGLVGPAITYLGCRLKSMGQTWSNGHTGALFSVHDLNQHYWRSLLEGHLGLMFCAPAAASAATTKPYLAPRVWLRTMASLRAAAASCCTSVAPHLRAYSSSSLCPSG